MDEAVDEIRRLTRMLEAGLDLWRDAPEKEASAERNYRKERARLWLDVPDGTAKSKEDWVDGESADKRYERDVARGLVAAYRESVRSRQTQISAWQTLVNAHRAEAELVGKGPREGP